MLTQSSQYRQPSDFEQKIIKRTKAYGHLLNLFVTFVFFCKIQEESNLTTINFSMNINPEVSEPLITAKIGISGLQCPAIFLTLNRRADCANSEGLRQ
jgi:hypothetical protein